MDLISIQQLAHFHALARRGSYARAAEELSLSQSALSRSIRALENDLGVRLVDRERGRTGIELTSAGKAVLAQADSVLASVAALREVPAASNQRTLAFGIGPQFATAFLSDVLRHLREADPDLRLDVTIGPTATMLEQLLDGELEFFISGTVAGLRPPRVRCDEFGSARMSFSVNADHPLLGESPQTLEAIARYPLYSGSVFRDRVLAEDDEIISRLAPAVVLDNFESLARLTASTNGVLASFAGIVMDPLVQLDFDISSVLGSSRTFLFTLSGIRLSVAAIAAIDELRTALAGSL